MTNRFEKDYKDRVIVFLDLMGIGNFTRTRTDAELHEVYSTIDRYINFNHDKTTYPDAPFTVDLGVILRDCTTYSSLSDSIVISLRNEYLAILPWVLQKVGLLQLFMLLTLGLPIRGAVTRGKIFHHPRDPIIFGKGLVEAHNLENKVAKFPRVLLDDSVISEHRKIYDSAANMQRTLSFFERKYPEMQNFNSFFNKYSQPFMERIIMQDRYDGKSIVNWHERSIVRTYETELKLNFSEQFEMQIQTVKEKCKDTKEPTEKEYNPNILEKWEYLERMIESSTKSTK